MQIRFASVGLLVLLVTAILAVPRTARAHPQGTFTINRYLRVELYQHTMLLSYVLDFSEIPSLQWAVDEDADDDGAISDAEMSRWVVRRRAADIAVLSVTADGTRTPLIPLAGEASLRVGDLGIKVLRYSAVYRVDLPMSGSVPIAVVDDGFAPDVPGWRAMIVRPSPGTDATVPDDALTDLSDGYSRLPPEWLAAPPARSSITFTWDPATGAPGPSSVPPVTQPPMSTTSSGGIGRLLSAEASPTALGMALLLAFLLGVTDALVPGHGKSVVIAHFGRRSVPVREALGFSLVAAATHVAVSLAIGVIALEASDALLPATAFRFAGAAAGLLVMGYAVALVLQRYVGLPLPHVFHRHASETASGSSAAASLTMGVASGAIPCPTAIILVLAAVSLGRLALGTVLVAAFSAGAATVLLGVALSVSYARLLSERLRPANRDRVRRFAAVLPALSATVLFAAGGIMLHTALATHSL